MSPAARRLRVTAGTIFLLTAMSAIGQFATTVYLPSLPAMATALQASPAALQQSLTAFLLAFGAGQLLVGPLSDRFGRRRVLFAGLAVFLAGTVQCALASDIGVLIAGRVLQALGACASVVTARAATRDSFEGAEMARVMGFISVVFGLVPGFAPLIGGLLHEALGWQAAFWTMGAFAVGLFAATWFALPETNARPLPALRPRDFFGGYGAMLRSWSFMGHALLMGAIFGALFSFLAGSPQLFIEHLGVSPAEYGIYPPMTVIGSMLGGLLTGRMAGRWSVGRLFAVGIGFVIAGAGGILALSLADGLTPWTVTLAMGIFVFSFGLVMPTAISTAMADFGNRAGSAAALIGFMQMAGSAAGPVAVALLAGLGLHAFPVAMAGFAGLSVLVWLALPAARRGPVSVGGGEGG